MSGVVDEHAARALFEVTSHRGVVNVRLHGELDLDTVADLAMALSRLEVDDGGLVQLDARAVAFIDCSALAVIDRAKHAFAMRGVTLWIVSPTLCVRALLDMTQSTDLLAPGEARQLGGPESGEPQ